MSMLIGLLIGGAYFCYYNLIKSMKKSFLLSQITFLFIISILTVSFFITNIVFRDFSVSDLTLRKRFILIWVLFYGISNLSIIFMLKRKWSSNK